jgi:putative colanic acid biosynthesis UDP-glucose lipid carrier transferase
MSSSKGIIQNNINRFAVLYRLFDYLALQAALFIAIKAYGVPVSKEYFDISLIAIIGFAFSAESFNLYRSWRAGYLLQVVFYTVLAWAVGTGLVLCFLFFSKTGVDYSRVVLGLWFVIALFALIGWRYCFAKLLFNLRARGFNTRDVVIIGLTENAVRLVKEIQEHPETGYRLKAIYDDRTNDRIDPEYHHLLKGGIDEGVAHAKNREFDTVFIALPVTAETRLQHILFLLGDTTINVQIVPDLFTYSLMNASMSHVGRIQTISVYDSPMRGESAILKRLEDIILSTLILSVIAIPMMLIALCVKLTSKGPVLFKQDRYGLDGRKIKIWKFRSMNVTENGETVIQATKNDARITPLGAFLRRSSLDELPQFFNVLKGDMSIVGPRPHAVAHNEQYRAQVGFYMLRHKVKPGITGWAQVNGWRGETDTLEKMEKRIEFDLEYIRRWSLWMDFKIVLFTVIRGFRSKNAY